MMRDAVYETWRLRLNDEIRKRKQEVLWLATEQHKAVVKVEGLRMVILGVDHEGEDGDFGPQASLDGIP